MERVVDRRAGLEVHKKTVTACVRVPDTSGGRTQHVRTFATTTAEVLMLRDWLESHRVSQVAMESTGVYWRPVFYVLEEACTCVAQLLERGLIRPSFYHAGHGGRDNLELVALVQVDERPGHTQRLPWPFTI